MTNHCFLRIKTSIKNIKLSIKLSILLFQILQEKYLSNFNVA